jgi:predicted DNA-binding transcriptional regulator AlpA
MSNPPLKREFFYIRDIEQITGRHRLTIWRWWKKGKFPKPFTNHSMVNVWKSDDIIKWIDDYSKNPEIVD